MIKSFYIDNFKSLVDFRLPPAPHRLGSFTCLVGLNGAGKSTVLQAFDFVGNLANGQVATWLKQREWKAADLTSRFLKKKLIHFELDIEVPGEGRIVWSGSFNTTEMRCTAETVKVDDVEQVLHIKDGQLLVSGTDSQDSVQYPLRSMKYEGSTLSFINVRDVHPALGVLKHVAANLRSLDLLSPQSMRRRAKDGADIGYGGERLSAFIHRLQDCRPRRCAPGGRTYVWWSSTAAHSRHLPGWNRMLVRLAMAYCVCWLFFRRSSVQRALVMLLGPMVWARAACSSMRSRTGSTRS